jgi:hypothetical protein
MSNKKIHELPELDPEDFEPGNDKFIIQSEGDNNKGTYSSTITEMINNGSAELPGSTDWQWNFLDEPATIAGYSFGGHTIESGGTGKSSAFTPKKRFLNDLDVTTDVDGKATGIPKTAQNYLCVVCSRNVAVNFLAPRGEIAVHNPEKTDGIFYLSRNISSSLGLGSLGTFYVSNDKIASPIQERVICIENISWPQNRKININKGEKPTYREAGKIHLSLQPHSWEAYHVGYH